MSESTTKRLGALLFPGFELLDVFGPLEMFGNLPGLIDVVIVAQQKSRVSSAQGPSVLPDYGFDDCPPLDLVLVPGGMGARVEVDNPVLIDWLRQRASAAEIAMTVCNGTSLMARTGLLDGRRATTNKMFFQSVADPEPRVQWVKEARWVEDGKFITSSGVSAGIDMALAVIAKLSGEGVSENLAVATEYEWHRDPNCNWDPVARVHKLVA
jgi:transcriptional regulator GlxA family with amidase domain